MKIGFSGTAGTGKTTLVEGLHKVTKFPVIKEGVREYLEENNIPSLRDLNVQETFKFQKYLLDFKKKQESNYVDFIADRTTADNMAYCLRWCSREESLEHQIKKYVQECIDWLNKTYDIIFFLPWGKIPYSSDGVRSKMEMYQLEIGYLIWGILSKEYNGDFVTISSVSVSDRIMEVLNYL